MQGNILEISTFKENTFTLQTNDGVLICHCEDSDSDWDKLYDHMADPVTIEITKSVTATEAYVDIK